MRTSWEAISRREFLARSAALAGAGMLGCSDSPESPSTSGLEHIIIVTMESRSFDHLLGWVPGAEGRQAGLVFADRDGISRATYRLTQTHGCGFGDLGHSYEDGRVAYNGGACDGWLKVEGNDLHAIGYYESADLPFLSRAATQWTVLDRYFAPIMAPTFPNRIIALAGQTDRVVSSQIPCGLPTIWDRLAAKNLVGRTYGELTTSHLWGLTYLPLVRPISAFYSDAAAGTLPQVAFVEPDVSDESGNSYHPPGDIRNGEAFLASIYRAVTTGPAWKSSLLVITFDESGGFFDHVPPPVSPVPEAERSAGNLDGLRGFRVPAILVSPFVKRGHVSSRVYDHTSVLKLIETRWALDPLAVRDAQANDIGDELDLSATDLSAPSIEVPSGPFVAPCS